MLKKFEEKKVEKFLKLRGKLDEKEKIKIGTKPNFSCTIIESMLKCTKIILALKLF